MSDDANDERTIFYSWQSDLPNGTNRGLIHEALEQAIKALNRRAVIEDVVRLDKDTQGVPGSPDIATTILGKIDAADVFVGDVSIVSGPEQNRPTPNPNVLVELGYAIKSLGWDRVILVVNTAFGPIEKLPFDLRSHRHMPYQLHEEGEKSPARAKLKGMLEGAIELALQGAQRKTVAPLESLRLAFDDGKSATMHRLLLGEAKRVASLVEGNEFDVQKEWSVEELERRIDRYRQIIGDLARMSSFAGAFFTSGDMAEWIAEAIAIVAGTIRPTSGKTAWLDLRWFPVRVLLYTLGATALHARNYRALSAVLLRKVKGETGAQEILAGVSNPYRLEEMLKELPRFKGQLTPTNNLLHEVVRPYALESIGGEDSFEESFDRFEYFLGLVEFHKSAISSFVGRYHWKRGSLRDPLPTRFRKDAEARGSAWEALSSGFFDGSLQAFQQTADRFQERLDRMHWF